MRGHPTLNANCFLRKASSGEMVLVVCNFTPVVRLSYRVGVPYAGRWVELLNSDSEVYNGSGKGNLGGVDAEEQTWHGRPYSLLLTVPPLAALFFKGIHPPPAPPTLTPLSPSPLPASPAEPQK